MEDGDNKTVHQHFHQPVGVVAGRDVNIPDRSEVLFVDMAVPQLKFLRAERVRWKWKAHLKICTSPPLIIAVLLILVPAFTIIQFALWGEVVGNLYYLVTWMAAFMINAIFFRKVIPGYIQFIRECDAEIAGIDNALTRKKMMSK
ncbi:MAG TPA: hypothetical protein VL995_21115 [Cellvibrio sp.]|nr:hypothetical protein [Cellvibrio sp.]